MAENKWQLSGDWFETCNCDYFCPCLPSKLAARPTKGVCYVAGVYHVKDGRFGNISLDGLNFVVVVSTPGPMGEGNWTVGLIIDEQASPEQRDALTTIASGKAGGPMVRLSLLMGKFAGVETKSILFEKSGMTRSVSVPGLLDEAVEGVPGVANPEEPLYIDNTGHPANPRLALGKATRSHLHAFGINWDDTGGRNNGHFAPFNWQGP
ncbi:MAG: DUF1326 domain-containing protein [Candidatus Binatia bacterium]